MKYFHTFGTAILTLSLATTLITAAPLPPEAAQKIIDLIPVKDPAVTNPPQLVEAMKGKHPRLLFTAEEIATLKTQIPNDPVLKQSYDGIKAWARISQVPAGPNPPIVMDDTSALVKSYSQAPAMAYAYALDHDPAMKQKIVDTLTEMLSVPYWANSQELDSSMGAACNMFMVALLFDSVYNDLDPEFRSRMAANILLHARHLYYLGHQQMLKYPGQGYWQSDPQPNHRWYRDMGLAACVLAVADEKDLDMGYLLQSLKDETDFVMKWYPPDGDCHEGASYQNFGYLAIVAAAEMMDRNLGTTYLKTSGIKNAGYQQLYYWLPGRKSDISYGDDQNGPAKGYGQNDAAFFVGPHLTRDKDMQAVLLQRLAAMTPPDKNGSPALYPWTMLTFYDPTVEKGDATALTTHKLFPDLGAATMRDSWSDDAVVFTFKCGPYGGYKLNEYRMSTPDANGNPHYINIAHDDPDANEFALSIGNGFAFHPGVYSIAHKVTRQHNTLTVDDKGQVGEDYGFTQPVGKLDMRTLSYLTGWKEGDKGRVIIEGEAGNAYRGVTGPEAKSMPTIPDPVLTKFRRTAIWMPGEYILVLDDVGASASHNLTWRGSPHTSQAGASGHNTATTETGQKVDFQMLSNHDFKTMIDDKMILDGRWGSDPVQQFQFSTNSNAVKFACLLDPWKKKPEMKLTEKDGVVTLAIHSDSFDDTWTWHEAKDAKTPSEITGIRGGAPLVSLTQSDKAPTE